MRTINSFKNITINVFSQIIIVALGFISRKVFLDSLGLSYLGVNGLLTNVLAMLSLAESGIGLSIVYSLYKPLAVDDKEKIIALIQLFKKAYSILAVFIFALSLAIYPVLGKLIRGGEEIHYVSVIYFIFVAKNIISYLNAHKWSLITADQKGYILSGINLAFQVLTTISKIVILVVTQNYITYLLFELGIYVTQALFNGKVVNRRYPYIKTNVKYIIDQETKAVIVKNIKALFLHNIGGYCIFGTDNILISSFINIATVGLYSNYTMVIGQLSSLIGPVLEGVGASIGNSIATENNVKNYSIFKATYLVNFWVYSVAIIFLYNVLEHFISWWLGNSYILNKSVFIVILINFYLTGMRTAISTFKSKAGLFVQDKYAPLIEAFINLVASVILLKIFGLAGVFLGTTISTLSVVFWIQPRIVYKYVFIKPVRSYFTKYVLYAGLTFITCLITAYICNILFDRDSFKALMCKGAISLIIPNIIYFIIFCKTEEFQYVFNIIKVALLSISFNKSKVIAAK